MSAETVLSHIAANIRDPLHRDGIKGRGVS